MDELLSIRSYVHYGMILVVFGLLLWSLISTIATNRDVRKVNHEVKQYLKELRDNC